MGNDNFLKVLKKSVNDSKYNKILDSAGDINTENSQEEASWWNRTMVSLEDNIGKNKSVEIMKECGKMCCGSDQIDSARKLMEESSSIKEFLGKLSRKGSFEYTQVDKNRIVARYYSCFCEQVNKLKGSFSNDIYCNCSAGYNIELFRVALNRDIDVRLKKSILNGSDFCEFEIIIEG